MLTAKDFTVVLYQATIFTPDEELSSGRVMRDFFPSCVERFDGEPVVLPIQETSFPREIPKVIMQSKSAMWRCEFASARVSYFWRKPKEGNDGITLKDFYTDAAQFMQSYMGRVNPRVGRLGAVIHRMAHHSYPARFLCQHFCDKRWLVEPLNRPQNFELHAHKRFSMGGQINVNSWVRNKTGTVSANDQNQPVVLLDQDINTLPEDAAHKNYTTDEIGRFFDLVTPEFDLILKLYYPEE